MNIKHLRLLLSKYGEVERIFLEKDKLSGKKTKRTKYVEGWIEFKKKSVAKIVAFSLNGKPIEGKRRSPFSGSLWNLKYLKRYLFICMIECYFIIINFAYFRFKWSHLAEQITYEKQLRDQKLRLEINSAKREANFYSHMIERSFHKKQIYNDYNRITKQRLTDEQITLNKQSDKLDEDLLLNIFK